ncbi:MAG: histidine kinase [Bacteroidales bacterium]|nr:histidine kinase [Bacteroidales bacterium]
MRLRDRIFLTISKIIWVVAGMGTLLSAGTLSGQNYFTENFTIDAGLPSNTVRAIFKDSRGIMWIGTASGLCRFDGREFTIYNSSNGLGAENIFDITEDDQGNLWIGAMGGGISRFDGRKFTNYSSKNGLVSDEVRRVWWSKKFNLLLAGTNNGCSVFDGREFYSLSSREIHSNTGTYFVLGFLERDDFIEFYAYGFDKVFRYYPATHSYQEDPSGLADFTGPSCSPLILNNGDTILGWGRQGIKVRNDGLKKSFDSIGQVFHMAVDDRNNIWIAAWAEVPSGPHMPGGLYLYDGAQMSRLSERTGITDPSTWTVFYDSVFHVVWVGTIRQGLFRMPFPCFDWYGPSYFGLTSIKINNIYSDKKDHLWIATSRQIIRMSGNGGYYIYPNHLIKSAQSAAAVRYHPLLAAHQVDRFGSYEKYEKLIAEGKFPFPNPYHHIVSDLGSELDVKAGSLYDPLTYAKNAMNLEKRFSDTSAVCFFAIGEDSRENIYVSGGFGLNRFKEGSNMRNPEAIPVRGNIWVFAFDESDTLFGSSYWDHGIWHCAINPEIQYPSRYFYSAERENAPLSPIRMISRGDEIWSASHLGGLYLTRDGKNYAFSKIDSTLPQNINDICFDGSENIIAGANNGEVLIARVEDGMLKTISRLGSKDGMVGKSIRWIQSDQKGYLYVGTNSGLNLINLDTLYETGHAKVKFFSPSTGFNELNVIGAVADSRGDIWVATEKKLCRIHHDLILCDPVHAARLVFTGIEINYHPVDRYSGYEMHSWFDFPLKPLKLAHHQNNLIFYFDALNYLNTDQQRFRYRLIPVITEWSDYSADRKAVFTTLQPGEYTLEVEGVNTLDPKQVSQLQYSFTIEPPFYLTWWFLLLTVVFLAGIGLVILHWRAKQIRKQEKKKADIRLELNSLEMKAMKAQMNPHFIFNAINSIQSFILSNNVDKALYYLSMFSKLVRKTLENSSKDLIPLYEELTYLDFYIELEKMRFEGEFTASTEIDPQLPLETVMIPPMIIQPFVENAIKHGLLKLEKTGHLKIEVKKLDPDRFQFVIEDNGIGRLRASEMKQYERQSYKSKGLEITNTRMRLLNENSLSGKFEIVTADLTDANGNPAGTRVEVTFPL